MSVIWPPNQFTVGNHTHSFDMNPPTISYMEWVYRKQEETMTTLEKVHKERKEAAERARIEMVYEALDALDLDGLVDGGVIRFNVDEGANVKTYAALHAEGRWWATGSTAPNGVGLEDLLAWMIRKNVILESVVTL